jgi:plastocyanin
MVLLGLVAAGAATAGGGCHAGSEAIATEGSSATVRLDGCTFAPTIARVPVGAEVRFVNVSNTYHDVTGRMYAWGSEQLESGESYAHRFTASGLYPYSCSLHPGMAGVVVVGDAAGSTADGAPPIGAAGAISDESPAGPGGTSSTVGVGALLGAGALVALLVLTALAAYRGRASRRVADEVAA